MNTKTKPTQTKLAIPFEKRDSYTEHYYQGCIPIMQKTVNLKEKISGSASINMIRNGKICTKDMKVLDTKNFDSESYTNLTTNLYINQKKNKKWELNVSILPTDPKARETISSKGVFKSQVIQSLGLMSASTILDEWNNVPTYGRASLLNKWKRNMVCDAKKVNKDVSEEFTFMEQFVKDATDTMKEYRIVGKNDQGQRVSRLPPHYMNNCSALESFKKSGKDSNNEVSKTRSNSNENKFIIGFSAVCVFRIPSPKGVKAPTFIAFIRIGSHTYSVQFDQSNSNGVITQRNGLSSHQFTITQTQFDVCDFDDDEENDYDEILLDEDEDKEIEVVATQPAAKIVEVAPIIKPVVEIAPVSNMRPDFSYSKPSAAQLKIGADVLKNGFKPNKPFSSVASNDKILTKIDDQGRKTSTYLVGGVAAAPTARTADFSMFAGI